jgi:GT2 family glycosyltransferase
MLDIIIVNYNSTDFLINCLNSIRESLNGVRADIFVQDNASTDGIERVQKVFPSVNFNCNKRNVGFAAGVNQVISKGKNPYVMLLNPDTYVTDKFFNISMDFIRKNPRVGIVGPKVIEKDGRLQNSARSFPTLLTCAFGRSSFLSRCFPQNIISRKNLLSIDSDGQSPMEVDWVSGACMLINRKAIESVGLLDERFFLYWEDADWCRRMWQNGWKVIYFPKATIYHYSGASSRKKLVPSILEFHKSAYKLFEKYLDSSLAVIKPFVYYGLLIRSAFVIGFRICQKFYKNCSKKRN